MGQALRITFDPRFRKHLSLPRYEHGGERKWDTILLEAVEVEMLERMGKRVEKLYRYVGCEEEKKECRYGRGEIYYYCIFSNRYRDVGEDEEEENNYGYVDVMMKKVSTPLQGKLNAPDPHPTLSAPRCSMCPLAYCGL